MSKLPPYQRAGALALLIFLLLNVLGVITSYGAGSGQITKSLSFTALVTVAILFLPAFVYRRIYKTSTRVRHSKDYGRRRGKLPFFLWATLLICCVVYLCDAAPQYVFHLLTGVQVSAAKTVGVETPAFLALSVLPVFFEEYLFRGTMLFDLSTNLAPGKAVLLTAIYFALLHGDVSNMLAPFAAGLLLGALVILLGSVKYAVAAHLAANTALALLGGAVNDENRGFLLLTAAALALIALYFASSTAERLIKHDVFYENAGFFAKRQKTAVPFAKASVLLPSFLILVCLFVVRVVTGI